MSYRVERALRYPANPDAPRAEWRWRRAVAGDIVDDIPAASIARLLEIGAITPAGEGDGPAPLPDDFPGRAALVAAGLTTLGAVREAGERLGAIRGIGPRTLAAIAQALEGGD